MSDLLNTLALSASGMKAQSTRLRHISENISNTDTPGYRRKIVSFEDVQDRAGGLDLVRTGNVRLDRSELERIFDPAHPMADESGHYDGSNVDLVVEIADARQAQRTYEANLRMFDQARKMTSSLFDLLRK
ncbi:flagellar basal body rod protein FlgC [Tropicimonas sp. IMCC6043]|uniref:flagellar basal body rod protein FlgC n=1 Tax=Tropicimonas sp. IMCC6043 TaxID=2510645 RepID=UPI00101CC58E|nr:flagellar basal body rod protein FlgC [Tropicimonas sp. IMCC6043]RYH07491.1 flagellar basal body rod protein FlgC [Tropicimonas sp. IMCC6043]